MSRMLDAVRCSFCGGIYDLAYVEVTARYTDCSMWKTPCCNNTADDRGDTGWKLRKDYVRVRDLPPDRAVDVYGHLRGPR